MTGLDQTQGPPIVRTLVLFLLAGCLLLPEAVGQVAVQPSGRRGRPSPEQIEQMKAARAQAEAQAAQQGGEKKPDGEEGKEEKKDEAKEEKPEVETVKRSTDPPAKIDRDELKARPDADGMVQFSFYGQRWEDVLQWYADVAELSLDWQELPADYLNLTAQRKYSLAETQDILNARLLARGFTMIKSGDVLSVVKISELDSSLIERIEPDELEDYSPHQFVRVRFPLPDSLDPAKAAEDVKILLSPNAKVLPLLATRRLHVIDAVVNLRAVRDLLYAEEAAETEDIRPQQFMVRHRRADYVADQVMIVLGLDPASRKTPQELQIEQQRMQLAMQMVQQKKDVSQFLKKDGPSVFIAVNQRRNSIIVNAEPREMEKIERTIEMFDVPDDGGEVWQGNAALDFKKYVTATASTDAVVSALKEIGRLHPLTQLQSDKPNRTIYATATPEDHEKIQNMIDRLDGSGRELHVIWLNKRSPADQIAGTITLLMGMGEEKEEDNSRRRRYYFGYWGGDDEEEADQGEMRIQPDVENNRLLLWATEPEHQEVRDLLEQIGALAHPDHGNPSQVRVLEARDPAEMARLLEQLRGAWTGDNPIEIQGAPQPDRSPRSDQAPKSDEQQDKVTRLPAAGDAKFRFASEGRSDGGRYKLVVDAADEKQANDAPPIRITVTSDGRLILTSDDLAALDQLESLLAELEPPPPEFVEYPIRHRPADEVEWLLREYFEEELQGQKETLYSYWGDYAGTRDKDTGPTTLGKRPLLRFIWDNDSNTIVVQNASASQLRVIEKLIDVYDQPPDQDSVATRRTEVISLKYSNAAAIATSLKDAYRDLLSSKDKEFQGRDGDKPTRTETHYRIYGGGSQASGETNNKSAPVKLDFEGALSIGVDEISNTLILSAQEQVFDNVVEIVRQLDEKARPSTIVQVHEVRGGLPSAELREALAQALGQPWPGGKPKKAEQQAQPQNEQAEEGGNNGRRRSRNRDRD